ncbi:MAG: hypothetical protein PVH12_02090 [Candidatus Bathyarchaeota archaeon]
MKKKEKWSVVSKMLNKEAELRVLLDALLDEEKPSSEIVDAEKYHWWKFLARKVAGIHDVWRFIRKAEDIRNQCKSAVEREARYCKLLKVPILGLQIIGDKLQEQLPNVNPLILTDSYTIRWVYTFQRNDETLKAPKEERVGNMLKTLRDKKANGDLNVDEIERLFKRACFINKHLASGDCDEYSDELIEAPLSVLNTSKTFHNE